MIPIGDQDDGSDYVPRAVFGLLGAVALVWLVAQGGGTDFRRFLSATCALALVPAELAGRAADGVHAGLCPADRALPAPLTVVTSMLAHADWGHLLSNALGLWVFGPFVEQRVGARRFLALALCAGVVAALAHVASAPAVRAPVVGASGVVAGIMGAYLGLGARRRVTMLALVVLVRLPAWLVLLYWLGFQVAVAVMRLGQPGTLAGTATWGHVGGFVAGLALAPLLARAGRPAPSAGGAPAPSAAA